MKNIQVLIDSLPTNKLEATNYRINESEMGRLGDEEIRVRTIAFAITAGTRAGLQGSASYAGAPTAGRVMNATGVGEVVESNDTRLSIGDRVLGPLGWQSYSDHRAETLNKIDSTRNPEDYLGPLGVNGLTAYFGLLSVARPKAGELVMVSAAAGSVGHLVGQMARIKECQVVGVMGSDSKGEILKNQLGFNTVVNYKDPNYRQSLKEATETGVDVYFDNTGGMILGSALFRMNVGGRIACCGVVSQYDTNSPEPGPKGIPGLLVNKRLEMKGFVVFDFEDRYEEARSEISGWMDSGKLISLVDGVSGLDAAPDAFVDLLAGGNIGTRLVRVSPD